MPARPSSPAPRQGCSTSARERSWWRPARPRSSRSAPGIGWWGWSPRARRSSCTRPACDLGVAVAVGEAPQGVPCTRAPRRAGADRGRGARHRGRHARRRPRDDDPLRHPDPGPGARPARRPGPDGRQPAGARGGVGRRDLPAPPGTDERDRLPLRRGRRSTTWRAVWARGFNELELVKRASLAGTGTCQGAVCLPHVRAWIAAKTGEAPAPFTARPASRQITLGEAAADFQIDAFRRTALHDEHVAMGARMDRFGGWWRPWHYGDHLAEYRAVRTAVSLGDVSTLGKFVVAGPDAVEFLQRLYPTDVSTIRNGRSRYALLLNERGHVIDDGMICREADDRFVLTFTTGGAGNAEMWMRDWIETWGLNVLLLDRTMSLAAINVTGPRAAELLARVGLDRAAALPPAPARRGRRRPVPRDAPQLHRRGLVRAAPPRRSVGRAVARPHGGRQGPRHRAARPAGALRAAPREGARDHRHGHRAGHDPAPPRHGLGGEHGEAVLRRPRGARAHRRSWRIGAGWSA